MGEFLMTTLVLLGFTAITPLLGLSCLFVYVTNKIWLWSVSFFNPELEFLKTTTIRTLVDTTRNQGIIAVLLTVDGPPHHQAVKRHLQEVVNRRDKSGKLFYPRLQQALVARCGSYAWKRIKFNLDQVLIQSVATHRGRLISSTNIQEVLSDISSKYMPARLPPWQMVIIPTTENQHYIFLRLHHVFLTEGLNITDLLPLIPPTRSTEETSDIQSPLLDVFKKPRNIRSLKSRLVEEFTNFWNEFVSTYDPLENPELMKSSPGFFELMAVVLIIAVSVLKECRKNFKMLKNDLFTKIKYLMVTLRRECKKRHVTLGSLVISGFVSADPWNILKQIFRFWMAAILSTVRIPRLLYSELKAAYSCVSLRYCKYPNTVTAFIYNHVPMFYYAFLEVAYWVKLLFYAPRTILTEIISTRETTQAIVPAGRKVVAWSDPVETAVIKAMAARLRTSETEILFATASAAISEYFAEAKMPQPVEIPVTARNINSNYIFLSGNRIKPEDAISGLLCLQLPVLEAEKPEAIVENLKTLKRNFKFATERQPISYLLTILQTKYGVITKLLPAMVIGVILKYLSRKYTVALTEVTSKHPNVTQRTMWGQEVTSAIYWRPPQSNMSVSLCFNQYANHIRLAVMCDSQLHPHHAALARGFPQHLLNLAEAAQILED